MPRYFFDLTDGDFIPDFIGKELADIDAARTEAIRLSAALLDKNTVEFWMGEERMIEGKDDCGLVLFTLAFRASDTPITRRSRLPAAGVGLPTL